MKEKVAIRDVVVWRARLDCTVVLVLAFICIVSLYHICEFKLKQA